MKNIFHSVAFTALILITGLSGSGFAQTRSATTPRLTNSLMATLPASDAVALVKVRRVFDEVLPGLFSEHPAKLAEVNSKVEEFKLRTGLDPRSFDELALGLRYSYPSAGVTRIDTVAIARGSFSAGALVAAGKAAASGAYREENYQGKTIYVFALDQQLRLFGLWDMKIRELAVSPLDANTLVLGHLESVRGAVATRRGARRGNAELIALASQDANAIISFGGNISPAVLKNLKIGNEAIAADLATVRQVYGSVGMNDKNLEMLIAARTVNPNSARNLSDTVEGLRQLGAVFSRQMSSAKGTLARAALGNLKITTQGNELQIRTAVSQAEVAPLLGGF